MKKLHVYFKLACNNILHNKLFALFCVIVSAFACMFMYVVLQLTSVIRNDTPPFSNASRVISFTDEFYDTDGRYLDGVPAPYIKTFIQGLRNYEKYAISNPEQVSILAEERLASNRVLFVGRDYFTINDFEFIEGRPFDDEEAQEVNKPAVISEKLALQCFNTTSVVGKQVDVQGNTYTIVGVIRDYSLFSTTKETVCLWLPYTTNKFLPSGQTVYTIDILFPEGVPLETCKQDLLFALRTFYKNRGFELDMSIDQLKTQRELRIEQYGDNGLYIGVSVVLLLLLLIPAINIITLSESSTQNRMEELAMRRACGATKRSIFSLVMVENLILVGSGFVIGLLCTRPAIGWIERLFFQSGAEGLSATLLTDSISIPQILMLIPLCIVFSLISGGIPAYMITRKNISSMLKGGSHD